MDIDFIKWMCEKAGFEYRINGLNGFLDFGPHESVMDTFNYPTGSGLISTVRYALYPLLLQRAIEGLNMEYREDFRVCFGTVKIFSTNIVVDRLNPTVERDIFEYEDFESIDKAKESALRYIYEQEQK